MTNELKYPRAYEYNRGHSEGRQELIDDLKIVNELCRRSDTFPSFTEIKASGIAQCLHGLLFRIIFRVYQKGFMAGYSESSRVANENEPPEPNTREFLDVMDASRSKS